MRTACVLCGSGQWPDACVLDDDDDDARGRVCVACGGRVATLICEAEHGRLTELWLLPNTNRSGDAAEMHDLEVHVLYRQMGLLEDSLLESATAYWEINDPEVRREALVVMFGLLREGALPRLKALLYPV